MKKIIIAAVIIFFIFVGIVGSITEDPETENKSVKKTQTSKPKKTKKPVNTSKPTAKIKEININLLDGKSFISDLKQKNDNVKIVYSVEKSNFTKEDFDQYFTQDKINKILVSSPLIILEKYDHINNITIIIESNKKHSIDVTREKVKKFLNEKITAQVRNKYTTDKGLRNKFINNFIKNPQTSKPKEKNILIDGLSIRPVMNGTGNEAIGKYGYVRISKENFKILCNDKVLINFVKKVVKKDLLYVIINFGDGTGLHGLESLYTYCEISKDKNGTFEAGKYLGNLKIYFDTNKVDRSNLNF
jgi:hypothetical protein